MIVLYDLGELSLVLNLHNLTQCGFLVVSHRSTHVLNNFRWLKPSLWIISFIDSALDLQRVLALIITRKDWVRELIQTLLCSKHYLCNLLTETLLHE